MASAGNLQKTSNIYRVYLNIFKFTVTDIIPKFSDHIGFAELYIPCDTTVALARNAGRMEPVADDVIIAMATKMEPPDPESPFEQNCIMWKHEPKTENMQVSSFMTQLADIPVQNFTL